MKRYPEFISGSLVGVADLTCICYSSANTFLQEMLKQVTNDKYCFGVRLSLSKL